MCLIAFAVNTHPDYRLILAANRDEFYERPTSRADYWEDHPTILGGRDLRAKGTWMAVNSSGKFAAITNYRTLQNIRKEAKSRGNLPIDYLLNSASAQDYLTHLSANANDYNGFNLLLFDGATMHHFSNYEGKINELKSGVYGISNAFLDTPWPKVDKLKEGFLTTISAGFSSEDLLKLLEDERLAEDNKLPDTGIGHDVEKMLSAIHIKSEKYGTCCSTVLTISYDGKVQFTERSFPVGGREKGNVSFNFNL